MRLDKFLQISRIVKQRQRAKAICDAGSARINGKTEKAGSRVQAGDCLELIVGNRKITAIIVSVPTRNVSKSEASSLIDIRQEEIIHDKW